MSVLTKEAEFLLLVQTVVQGLMSSTLSSSDLSTDEKAAVVNRLCASLSIAADVASRIPDDRPAFLAASDYTDRLLDNYLKPTPDPRPRLGTLGVDGRADNLDGGGAWMGLSSWEEFKSEIGPTEDLIDGKWQLAKPEWATLPLDDSLGLKLLTHIRKALAPVTMSDLAKVTRASSAKIENRLSELEKEGWVSVEGHGRTAHWQRTPQLMDTIPSAKRLKSPDPIPDERPRRGFGRRARNVW